MSWRYKRAKFRGNKVTPKAGDSVTVVIEEATDPENVQEREFTYGFDGRQAKGRFIAMVRAEVKAHLRGLNASAAEDDVTSVFEPV